MGLALTLNFIVTRVPLSLGMILGFSVNVGGMPSSAAATAAGPPTFAGSSAPFSPPAFIKNKIHFIRKNDRF